MAVKIRLRQQGRTNRTSYRLVVADSRSPRDGKYIENLGFYDPLMAQEDNVKVDHERVAFWVGQGAQVSENVMNLLKKAAPELYRNLVNRELEKRQNAKAKKDKA
jgi:small subunit ribosomal protein S16